MLRAITVLEAELKRAKGELEPKFNGKVFNVELAVAESQLIVAKAIIDYERNNQ